MYNNMNNSNFLKLKIQLVFLLILRTFFNLQEVESSQINEENSYRIVSVISHFGMTTTTGIFFISIDNI